ncbi:MAG: DNA translocase FtsK [Deltaproteobacteria bacterium]|nr:DNA translocase FtsK [Deltaproteobacteria bacterium]
MTARYLNLAGAYVVAGTLFFIAFIYATHVSLFFLLRWSWQLLRFGAHRLGRGLVIAAARSQRGVPKLARALAARYTAWQERRAVRAAAAPMATRRTTTANVRISRAPDADGGLSATDHEPPAMSPEPPVPSHQSPATASGPKIFERRDLHEKEKAIKEAQLELARISENYVFPSLALLDSPNQQRVAIDEASLRHNAKLLEGKLEEYGIQGRVSEIHPGPVVTMYEFEPAAGVKVNKIVGVEDDLSVSLGGRSVRIVAHIPGKAAVGIEVPNAERETVWLKEIIGDQKFRRATTKLPLAMGKNIEGHPVLADLTKMPHLLVAGATGSGKSVAINAMICSILYKATPAEVRMILVDPKMLELSIYEGIPHLLLPVVTKPKQATLALNWGVREMERRYQLLSAAGVRNISTYNEQIERGELECVSPEEAADRKLIDPEAAVHTGTLPYIVIIIDEMADLMMVSGREIEESVTRLAQMARAAGIHLIVATQRPSVDVITGIIKANFPSRVAFKVSSKHDGRTIIDAGGAEQLLGMGDMLFMGPNSSALVRIHGAFITETETQRIVAHVKQQGQARYDESILKPPTAVTEEIEGENDELYDQAVRLVTETGQASISMVQRRLRIGYNRAARLIERMEMEGVVGPSMGSKPREILVQAH